MAIWNSTCLHRSPLFEPLRVHGKFAVDASDARWPTLAELQVLVSARVIVSGGGQPLRLVPQEASGGGFEDRYEVRIYRQGELQLRMQSWHDLFNLLAWLTFPRAKAAINARHYRALLEQQSIGALNRGTAQDTLTLFDESGVIIASSDAELLQDVREFSWKRLFWQRRERLERGLRCLIFGHGLYEKALQPFVGITGHGVLFDVDPGFWALPPVQQLQVLDGRLAERIADETLFCATRELAPLPLLGLPGWWPDNCQESFYDNTGYFRPGRRQAAAP